jgi:hypothetical protein
MVFCGDMPEQVLRKQVLIIFERGLLPGFGEVIDALMRKAALPIPSFEVAHAPMNIPMLVILFGRLPAGESNGQARAIHEDRRRCVQHSGGSKELLLAPVRQGFKASTHHAWCFFTQSKGWRAGL